MSDPQMDFRTTLTVDPSSFLAGWNAAQRSARQSSADIAASTARMQQAIGGLQAPIASTQRSLAGMATPMPGVTASIQRGADQISSAAGAAGRSWADAGGDIGSITQQVSGSFKQLRDSIIGSVAAINTASDNATSSLNGISQSIAKVVLIATGLGASFKAGDFLIGLITGDSYKTEGIDALIKMNDQVKNLQGSLKVGAQEAHAYIDAMARLGVDAGDVVSVHEGIEKAIRDNTDELDRLGVKYKDANGELLTHEQILGNVKNKLDEYADGYDRSAAAAAIGIGSYTKVNAALKINSAELEKSKARLDDYQLAIGPDTQTAVAAYEQAMRDFNNESQLMSQGLKRAVTDSVMPILTDLAVSLKDGFPSAVRVFRVAVASVTTLFYSIQVAASGAFQVVQGVAAGLSAAFSGMGAAASKALKGDFSGAGDSVRAGLSGAETEAKKVFEGIAVDAENAKKRLDMAWATDDRKKSLPEVRAENKPQPGSDKKWVARPKKKEEEKSSGAEKSQMQVFEAALAERKVAIERAGLEEDQIRHMSKEAEIAYWNEIRQRSDISLHDKSAAAKKAAEVELVAIKEGFDFKIATLNAEGAHYRSNMEERLRIEREIQSHYAEGTKERADSERKIVEIQRAAAEQEKQIVAQKEAAKRNAQLSTIALAEQAMQQAQQLGLMDNQKALTLQQQFENQRYQIALSGLQQRLAVAESDPDRNLVEIGQVHAEIEALEQQHQMRMGQIKGALVADAVDPVKNVAMSMQGSFASAIDGILSKTMTLRQGLIGIWKSISTGIIGEIAKIMAKKAAEWAVEKAMTVASIGAKALDAGAGAAASQAAIPIVGPSLAMAAMAAVTAGVMGLQGSVASASGGFDIPANVNPLTQLHEKEMVLPANHADTIRRLGALGDRAMGNATGLAGSDGAMPPVQVVYNDHSGRLTPDDIRRNSNVIGDIVNQQLRDNRIKTR